LPSTSENPYVENWEQGRAKPNAQAALLINLVRHYPDTVQRLAAI
jgi:putative transcriptional regulator